MSGRHPGGHRLVRLASLTAEDRQETVALAAARRPAAQRAAAAPLHPSAADHAHPSHGHIIAPGPADRVSEGQHRRAGHVGARARGAGGAAPCRVRWERATIAARTTASLQAKRARGESIGRPAVVDQPELAARIATLRAEGLTLQAICDQLNADRVPTPRGAAMWRRSSVQSAAGYTRPRPRRLPPELPPLPRRRKTSR